MVPVDITSVSELPKSIGEPALNRSLREGSKYIVPHFYVDIVKDIGVRNIQRHKERV
jgi:hypothetical protein